MALDAMFKVDKNDRMTALWIHDCITSLISSLGQFNCYHNIFSNPFLF